MKTRQPKKGDRIRIIRMNNSGGKDIQADRYAGREGTVTGIDDKGQIHGTWGGLALLLGIDEYEVMN